MSLDSGKKQATIKKRSLYNFKLTRGHCAYIWYFGCLLHGHPKLVQYCPNLVKHCCAHIGDYMREPKVLLRPPQKWIFGPKNGQSWPKTDIFGQISAFSGHLVPCPTKKQYGHVAWVVLS